MSTGRSHWRRFERPDALSAADVWQLDIRQLERELVRQPETFWTAAGARRALALFHAAARRVPAYRDFLSKHHIRHATVRTTTDLEKVLFTDKTNYVNEYPLASRCWDGRLDRTSLVAVSSGTSGRPSFWPRKGTQEAEAALIHELAYRSLFSIHRSRTLAVIGFPMGVYVSGVATLIPTWLTAQRGYSLTTVSVGNHKDQALRAIEQLWPDFEQVLIIGHPFFVKDLLETGKRERIPWRRMQIKMMFCSEGFSEAWRSYLNRQASLPAHAKAAYNTYGSSETLLIGHETPLTIALRRAIREDPAPNLFQYNPLLRFIQTHEHELLFTCDNGVPLIRYNLHDAGTLVPFSQAAAELRRSGGHVPGRSWRLPIVSLTGRSDHTLVFYAANIYPEHIHASLNDPRFLRSITGKFTMRKGYDRKHEAFLELNVELRPDAKPGRVLARSIAHHVTAQLRRINMEYDFLWNHLGKDLTPHVTLRTYQDPDHFRPGLKPMYLIKD